MKELDLLIIILRLLTSYIKDVTSSCGKKCDLGLKTKVLKCATKVIRIIISTLFQRVPSPSLEMKQKTVLATQQVARILAKQSIEQDDKVQGKLLKGK